MKKVLSIGVLVYMMVQQVMAQDSLQLHVQGVRERTDQLEIRRNDFYQLPALRPFQYKNSMTPVDIAYFAEDKDKFNLQEGSGEQGLRISTTSYVNDLYPKITLWGKANYENIKIKNLKFNETSDYNLVFPYVTADTVGGDLSSELYHFSGGLAKEIGSWYIAGEAGYRANQAHRKRDPRPDNNTSDIQAKLGVAYSLPKDYVIAAHIGARFYKQKHTLSFVAEKGRPAIYQLNGLAAYNSLLSGSSESSGAYLFKINGFDAQLTFAPKETTGLVAEVGIQQNSGARTLPSSSANSNNWTDQVISGKLGYIHVIQDWKYGLIAETNLQTRKGKEGLFNNNGANSGGYTKISELSSYRYYHFDYRVETFIGQKDWSIKPYGSFSQLKEQYVNPFREQRADILNFGVQGQYLVDLNAGIFGISVNLQKQKLLDKHAVFNISQDSPLADLLNLNYAYLTAEPFTVAAEARYDFVASKQIKPFVKANAQTSTQINQKLYAISFGFMF